MKRTKGFTTVELLVALTIAVLISLVSVPLLVNYQRTTKLRSEARILATDLRYAQQLAVTEQNVHSIVLNDSAGSYQIINTESGSVVKTVTFNSEISITEVTGLTSNTVQYNPGGAAFESGSIALTNSNNQTSTVIVKPSGYVEITDQ